jgi:hypothetical protein
MADFVIAVRTYKRASTFVLRTYKTLEENNLTDRLYIFVASEEERVLYETALAGKTYKELIVAELGAQKAMNFAIRYFPEGKPIVFFDDDLYRFFTFNSAGKYCKRAINLKDYILDGFQTTEHLGTNGFGFSFIGNKLYLKGKPFKEFRTFFLPGNCFALRNDHSLIITETDGHLDDAVRNLRLLERYRGVLIYWWGGFETYYGTEAGGLQSYGRENQEEIAKNIWNGVPNIQKYYSPPFVSKEGIWSIKMKNIKQLKKVFASDNIALTTREFPWEDFASQ